VIRPIVILGKGPEAADLALHRVLRFKECAGPLLVLDWIGRGAPLLHGDNAGGISKRPVAWCDLANRQRPVGVFGLRASGALHGLLSGVLAQLRAPTHASLRDEALAWAADVGARLAEEGEVGLAAWHQTLRRPDVKRWFPSAQTSQDEREALARMLSWALRFPSVYTVSEAPNRVPLTTALQKMQTTWIEMPVEQFEPLEHRVVTLLVQAALWDGLWRSKATGPAGATPERVSTVLQLFPLATEPALTERLKGTASGARHLAVFALSADRAPGPALKDWIDAGADIWVIGQRGLPVAPLTPWLGDDARRRLSSLEGGDLWVRSGATGRAIVVKVRRSAPVIPVPWRFRLYAARRRRALAVTQIATAVDRAGRRAGNLYDRLCDKTLLRAAWLRVAQGRPDSHGVDSVTIARFKASVDAELDRLVEELESRQYRARPLRVAVIPKTPTGHRQLRISCVRDRVVQTACLSLLEPIFEPTFSHFSFAFRPRRSAHHALALARSFIAAGSAWAVIADIERCFDTIDHDLLLDRVARRVADPMLLALLRHWLTADVLDFRDLVPMDVGVPQGSPISPLLANVYLDPLDRHFEERRLDFVRYADDFLVFAADEPKALDALRAMATFLHDPLRLALKPAKTAHVRVTEGVDFLGFRLSGGSVAIQPDKVDRATAALHAWLAVLGAPHTSFLERTRTLGRVNGLVRGFRAYYALPDEPAISRNSATWIARWRNSPRRPCRPTYGTIPRGSRGSDSRPAHRKTMGSRRSSPTMSIRRSVSRPAPRTGWSSATQGPRHHARRHPGERGRAARRCSRWGCGRRRANRDRLALRGPEGEGRGNRASTQKPGATRVPGRRRHGRDPRAPGPRGGRAGDAGAGGRARGALRASSPRGPC
jgi:group II intron reverse transcriptase/maturase